MTTHYVAMDDATIDLVLKFGEQARRLGGLLSGMVPSAEQIGAAMDELVKHKVGGCTCRLANDSLGYLCDGCHEDPCACAANAAEREYYGIER